MVAYARPAVTSKLTALLAEGRVDDVLQPTAKQCLPRIMPIHRAALFMAMASSLACLLLSLPVPMAMAARLPLRLAVGEMET